MNRDEFFGQQKNGNTPKALDFCAEYEAGAEQGENDAKNLKHKRFSIETEESSAYALGYIDAYSFEIDGVFGDDDDS